VNEASWLAAEDPILMLDFLNAGLIRPGVSLASPRKMRLFAAACALLLPRRTLGLRRSVEAALAFADGEIGASKMEAERWDIGPGGWTVCNPDAGEAAYYVIRDDLLTDRRAEMAALLREIFGNPFRSAPPACKDFAANGRRPHLCKTHRLEAVSWGTSFRCPASFQGRYVTPTVLRLARGAYDDRDFAVLPLLADALEDAGCGEETLLRHLRGQDPCPCLGVPCCAFAGDPDPRWREAHTCVLCRGTGRVPSAGPHARGCWALDLVLGKS
jgi:hypothetical protein